MAQVFLGHDEVLERSVAVKVLWPEEGDAEMGERFRREGRTAARLSHPNIVQVYDAGEGDLDGQRVSYIVMEHVSGGDLKELIDDRGFLAREELARLGSGVCAGLSHAHEKGIIHRDIKPHNILLDETGRPKLADFGIARALDVQGVTRTGFYLGTALYSAPEQLRGGEVTPKSDVYSLGATLYQTATGRTPFSGTPMEVATRQVSEYPISPGAYNPELGGDLGALIMDCLEKDPARRPSAETLGYELSTVGSNAERNRTYATKPAPAQRAPQGARPSARYSAGAVRSGRRRSPVLAVAAVALLLALAAGTVFTFLNANATDSSADGSQPSGQQEEAPPGDTPDASGSDGGDPSPDPQQQTPSGEASGSGNSGGDPGDSADSGAPQNGQQDSSGERPGQSREDSPEAALSGRAAAQTVRQLYSTAASGDYGVSYNLLSQGFRQRNAPTQQQWSRQFGTLERITFVEGPNVRVSGSTATVTGVTVAEHTDRTERNTVSWSLLNEGGEWKISSLSIVRQERLQA